MEKITVVLAYNTNEKDIQKEVVKQLAKKGIANATFSMGGAKVAKAPVTLDTRILINGLDKRGADVLYATGSGKTVEVNLVPRYPGDFIASLFKKPAIIVPDLNKVAREHPIAKNYTSLTNFLNSKYPAPKLFSTRDPIYTLEEPGVYNYGGFASFVKVGLFAAIGQVAKFTNPELNPETTAHRKLALSLPELFEFGINFNSENTRTIFEYDMHQPARFGQDNLFDISSVLTNYSRKEVSDPNVGVLGTLVDFKNYVGKHAAVTNGDLISQSFPYVNVATELVLNFLAYTSTIKHKHGSYYVPIVFDGVGTVGKRSDGVYVFNNANSEFNLIKSAWAINKLIGGNEATMRLQCYNLQGVDGIMKPTIGLYFSGVLAGYSLIAGTFKGTGVNTVKAYNPKDGTQSVPVIELQEPVDFDKGVVVPTPQPQVEEGQEFIS